MKRLILCTNLNRRKPDGMKRFLVWILSTYNGAMTFSVSLIALLVVWVLVFGRNI